MEGVDRAISLLERSAGVRASLLSYAVDATTVHLLLCSPPSYSPSFSSRFRPSPPSAPLQGRLPFRTFSHGRPLNQRPLMHPLMAGAEQRATVEDSPNCCAEGRATTSPDVVNEIIPADRPCHPPPFARLMRLARRFSPLRLSFYFFPRCLIETRRVRK